MRAMRSGVLGLLLATGAAGFMGCGGNPNEPDVAKMPPGKKSDDPEDKNVAHRRERTRNVLPKVQKLEEKARAKAEAEKAKNP